jgi:hypothetical protein
VQIDVGLDAFQEFDAQRRIRVDPRLVLAAESAQSAGTRAAAEAATLRRMPINQLR